MSAAPAPAVPDRATIAAWTVADVCLFVTAQLQNEAYAAKFQDSLIDGRMFLGLSDSDLEVLGIANPFHRRRLLGALPAGGGAVKSEPGKREAPSSGGDAKRAKGGGGGGGGSGSGTEGEPRNTREIWDKEGKVYIEINYQGEGSKQVLRVKRTTEWSKIRKGFADTVR